MITQKTCYTITCDGCRSKLDWDYEPHFDSPEMARELATDDGEFWTDGTTDLCGMCKRNAHEYIPSIAGRDDVECERCGLDQDDHEPETTEAVAR